GLVFGVACHQLLEPSHKVGWGEGQFTDYSRGIPVTTEYRGQSRLRLGQTIEIGGRAVDVRITAGVHGCSRGYALRTLHIVLLEQRALGGKPVEVGRADDGVTEGAQAIGAKLIVGDQQDIGPGRLRLRHCRTGERAGELPASDAVQRPSLHLTASLTSA